MKISYKPPQNHKNRYMKATFPIWQLLRINVCKAVNNIVTFVGCPLSQPVTRTNYNSNNIATGMSWWPPSSDQKALRNCERDFPFAVKHRAAAQRKGETTDTDKFYLNFTWRQRVPLKHFITFNVWGMDLSVWEINKFKWKGSGN